MKSAYGGYFGFFAGCVSLLDEPVDVVDAVLVLVDSPAAVSDFPSFDSLLAAGLSPDFSSAARTDIDPENTIAAAAAQGIK
jgi:hypothetical protein